MATVALVNLLALSEAAVVGMFAVLTALVTGATTIIVTMLSRANTNAKEAVSVAKVTGDAATALAAQGLVHNNDLARSLGLPNGHGTVQDQLRILLGQADIQEAFRAQTKDTQALIVEAIHDLRGRTRIVEKTVEVNGEVIRSLADRIEMERARFKETEGLDYDPPLFPPQDPL